MQLFKKVFYKTICNDLTSFIHDIDKLCSLSLSLFPDQSGYSFPMDAVTNNHKLSSLKQEKFILTVGWPQVQNSSLD